MVCRGQSETEVLGDCTNMFICNQSIGTLQQVLPQTSCNPILLWLALAIVGLGGYQESLIFRFPYYALMLSPFFVLLEVCYNHQNIKPQSKFYPALPVASPLCLSEQWQGKGGQDISNLSISAPTTLFSCCVYSFLCSTLP